MNKRAQKAIDAFRERFPELRQLETTLERALWALAHQKHVVESPSHISDDEISDLLRQHDFSAKPLSIARALAPAGDKVDRRGSGALVSYRIMQPGEAYLCSHKELEGLRVVYVDGSAAWSDRRLLVKDLARKLYVQTIIVDKYIGVDSLDLVANLGREKSIRFLTARVSGNRGGF